MTKPDQLVSMDDVTDLHLLEPEPTSLAAAVRAADAAATAAGVRLREISELDDLDAVYRLYDGIWHPDPTNPPVTIELMRALTKAGNYVTGAYDDRELIGACVGFFGAPAGEALHSHIAGVAATALGRNVGYALKLHQRAWAMTRGVTTIGWTFDPLVSRNAYFNLGKLAADAVEYLPNFYGDMNDRINGSDDTDRLFVHWRLDAPQVAAACAGAAPTFSAQAARARGAVVGLARSEHDTPVPGTLTGDNVLVAIPTDIGALRAANRGRAKQWRVAVREVLVALMADGARVAEFDKSGWYLVTRIPPGEDHR